MHYQGEDVFQVLVVGHQGAKDGDGQLLVHVQQFLNFFVMPRTLESQFVGEGHHLLNDADWTLVEGQVVEDLDGRFEGVLLGKQLDFLMNALLSQVDLRLGFEIGEDIHNGVVLLDPGLLPLKELHLLFHNALVVGSQIQLKEEFVVDDLLEVSIEVDFALIVDFLLDEVLCLSGPLHQLLEDGVCVDVVLMLVHALDDVDFDFVPAEAQSAHIVQGDTQAFVDP